MLVHNIFVSVFVNVKYMWFNVPHKENIFEQLLACQLNSFTHISNFSCNSTFANGHVMYMLVFCYSVLLSAY